MRFSRIDRIQLLHLVVGMLGIGLCASPTFAQQVANGRFVTVSLHHCDVIRADEVNRILQMEIQSSLSSKGFTLREVELAVQCVGNMVNLAAYDVKSETTFSRNIEASLLGESSGERVIAIAAAELTLYVWERFRSQPQGDDAMEKPFGGEVDALSKPPAETLSRDVKFNAEQSSDEYRNRLSLNIGALWQLYPKTGIHQFGGEAGLDVGFSPTLFVRAALAAEGGIQRHLDGDISLFSMGVMIGTGIRREWIPLKLAGGMLLGGRVGYGRMAGRAESTVSMEGAVAGPVGGPLMRMFLQTGPKKALGLCSEIGYAVFRLSGNVNQEIAAAMSDLWILVMVNWTLF